MKDETEETYRVLRKMKNKITAEKKKL